MNIWVSRAIDSCTLVVNICPEHGAEICTRKSIAKGASAWLNVLPLKRYGFHLKKSEFRDGLSLRSSWNPTNAPLNCQCGEILSLIHALHCPKGGSTIVHLNEIRDTFANLMSEVCRDVAVEPILQPLDGETFDRNSTSTATDDARLDIKSNGLWATVFERTFFDVKIFNPLVKSCPKTIRDSYKYHEELKKLKYGQRIRDGENSTFNTLVFSSAGGAGPSASKVMKRLAQKISVKREEKYSNVMSFVRTKMHYWRAPFYVSEDAEPLNRHAPLKTRSPAFWPKVKSTKVQ